MLEPYIYSQWENITKHRSSYMLEPSIYSQWENITKHRSSYMLEPYIYIPNEKTLLNTNLQIFIYEKIYQIK